MDLTPIEQLKGRLGVELYTAQGRLRADDNLIRERVGRGLGEVSSHIRTLMSRWNEERVPLPTREQPFPPAAVMEPLKTGESLLRRVEATSTSIRGLPLLNEDKVWKYARSAGLQDLVQFDWALVAESDALAEEVTAVRALDEVDRDLVEERLGRMDAIARQRRHYVEIMP